MAESFARLLRRHRVAAGLSQEGLAELAGVSTDAISALERGFRRAPHKATFDLLIAALALDDDARLEIEEAAALARERGPQAQRNDDVLQNNLPPQLTSFVDREREVAEIKEKLQSSRLVTLVGTGGAGKTRCAIRVARDMLDDSSDGVWIAELAPITDPAFVAGVIAHTLMVKESANHPIVDTLLAYLKRKRLLLILDNCEHVIEEARRVAFEILQGCPNVRILATSRQSFTISGEQVYQMPSLPVPSASELLSLEQLSQYGAVRLFSDRAVSADNRFTLTHGSATHVADICRRLDGIPLAIELAAARVKTLSPKQLAQMLDERFRVLTGGDRSALPRHRTMRALIDWSYDLLSEDERALFRKLSIFAGGFTLETATAVCTEDETDEIAVLDQLASLVDKSLVQAEEVQSGTRYRLLESTREYARERLANAGEADAVAQAHARAFLAVALQLDEDWDTTPDRVWFAQAELEFENIRAALSWTLGMQNDVQLGQRLAATLCRGWLYIAPAEAGRYVASAQERADSETPPAVLTALDLAEASLAALFGHYKGSLHAAERALVRCREFTNQEGVAEAQLRIGRVQIVLGEIAEGEELTAHVLESARELGARMRLFALDSLACARLFAGDFPTARQRWRRALATARALGADRDAAVIATNLAEAEFRGGDAPTALHLASEALLDSRAFGDTRHVATAAYNLAAYLVALHRYGEARAAARDALTAARDAQFSVGLAWTLQHLAAIAALRPGADVPAFEDRLRAARILGYVDACLSALGALREYTEQQEYDAMILALRDGIGEDELSRLMADGSAWNEDQAVAEALSI